MKIDPGPNTVSRLFSDDMVLTVPSFQRNYTWETSNTEQFLNDVFTSAKTGESHFYGPIVLLHDDDDEHQKIIDGQQRLTSVFILLSLLRDEASILSNRVITPDGPEIDQVIRNFMYKPLEYTEPRFAANYLVRDIFQERILAAPMASGKDGQRIPRIELTVGGAKMTSDEKNRTKGLRKNYVYMKSRLASELKGLSDEEKKKQIRRIFDALTKRFEIHSMVLRSEDDAYILFETLNDRGMKLSPSDLLKTITLREIRAESPGKLQNALSTWDQVTENLGDYDFSKFLRHYLLTQTRDSVQKPKILAKFKGIIASNGEGGAWKNLTELQQSSVIYRTLLGLSEHPVPEVARVLARINSISDTHRVLLLEVFRHESRFTSKELERVVRAVEGLVVRWLVSGKNAQILENRYQEILHDFAEGEGAESCATLFENIIQLWPRDEEVFPLTTKTESPDLQKYFLRRIEDSAGGVAPSWSQSMTLEHLAPQDPDKANSDWLNQVADDELKDDKGLIYSDYVYNWGNLALLEKSLNSAIKNADWNVKVLGQENSKFEGLNSSNLGMIKHICKVKQWNRETILDRQAYLDKSIEDLISEDWARGDTPRIKHWRFE